MKIEDTGLGIPRTDRVIVLQVTTRPRTRVEKETFYELLCQELVQQSLEFEGIFFIQAWLFTFTKRQCGTRLTYWFANNHQLNPFSHSPTN
jgi:hypothetical protein